MPPGLSPAASPGGGRTARVLVDCGLFQGDRDLAPPQLGRRSRSTRRHWTRWCSPTRISTTAATCRSWRAEASPVRCSARHETARLAAIVLRDAAHLQEEEARWARDHRAVEARRTHGRCSTPPTPSGRSRCPAGAGRHQNATVGEACGGDPVPRRPHPRVSFAVMPCGRRPWLFSGDLGRPDHPLLLPPESRWRGSTRRRGVDVRRPAPPDRRPRRAGCCAPQDAGSRRGGARDPGFAVDRTPLVLHEIRQLVTDGRVPDVPVFVDSPMALAALEVYRCLGSEDSDWPRGCSERREPFDPGHLRLVHGRRSPRSSTTRATRAS